MSGEIVISKKDLQFIIDVAQIAKYKLWDSDVGDYKAQQLIDEIHNNKYGSTAGIWVQFNRLIGGYTDG